MAPAAPAAGAPTPGCSASPVTLVGPASATAAVTAKPGVTFDALPTNFNFDGLGQPITSAGVLMATQTIQVANSAKAIQVEAATGYVHESP
jgi:MSHA pilin protein MshC